MHLETLALRSIPTKSLEMIEREKMLGSCSEYEALAIYQEVKSEGNWMGFLKNYLYDEDYQVGRNALWSLTKATDEELTTLQPMLHELIDHAMQVENSSVRRLTLNIIERLTMEEDDLRTDFLDFCLDHMSRLDEYPGIQSLCMKLAYRICKFYPELMEELKRTIEGMEMEYYKPAVKSVSQKILSGKMKG